MTVIFWISIILLVIAIGFLYRGFVNVYYKNYNGGKQSSSGSIIYPLIITCIILLAGLACYFTGYLRIATLVTTLPIVLTLLYFFIRIFVPLLMGGRMN